MKFIVTKEGEIYSTRTDGIYIGKKLESTLLNQWRFDLDDPFFKEAEEFFNKLPKEKPDPEIPVRIDLLAEIEKEKSKK